MFYAPEIHISLISNSRKLISLQQGLCDEMRGSTAVTACAVGLPQTFVLSAQLSTDK